MSSFKTTQGDLRLAVRAADAAGTSTTTSSAWTTAGIGSYFVNTVIVVGCALVIVMVLGAMCAYVLARFAFFGSRLIYYLMLAGLTFPIFLAIVPLFFVLKNIGAAEHAARADHHLRGVRAAVHRVLPLRVLQGPAATRSPRRPQIDGAGEWRTFFQVMLPMARPGMASVAIFNFLGLWNQFLLPGRPEHQRARTTCCPRAWRRSPRRRATRSTSARCSPPS